MRVLAAGRREREAVTSHSPISSVRQSPTPSSIGRTLLEAGAAGDDDALFLLTGRCLFTWLFAEPFEDFPVVLDRSAVEDASVDELFKIRALQRVLAKRIGARLGGRPFPCQPDLLRRPKVLGAS